MAASFSTETRVLRAAQAGSLRSLGLLVFPATFRYTAKTCFPRILEKAWLPSENPDREIF